MIKIGCALLFLAVLWVPAWFIIDSSWGVSGFEMESVNPQEEWPEDYTDFGFEVSDPVAEKLSLYGKPTPAGFDRASDGTQLPRRYLFVPDERQFDIPNIGPVVVFDRTKNEEFMQANSLWNISLLVSAGNAVFAVFILIIGFVRKARKANQGSVEA